MKEEYFEDTLVLTNLINKYTKELAELSEWLNLIRMADITLVFEKHTGEAVKFSEDFSDRKPSKIPLRAQEDMNDGLTVKLLTREIAWRKEEIAKLTKELAEITENL